MRNGFASAAINPIMKSYTETMRFIRGEGASESHGETRQEAPDNEQGERAPAVASKADEGQAGVKARSAGAIAGKVPIMEGERIIFMDELGPGQYLKIIASGELDMSLIEAMEDFTKRRKKRLPAGATKAVLDDDEDNPDNI